MRNIILMGLSLLSVTSLYAKNPKVKSVRQHDNSLYLFMDKKSDMPYTAFLKFESYNNVKNKPGKENTIIKVVAREPDAPDRKSVV